MVLSSAGLAEMECLCKTYFKEDETFTWKVPSGWGKVQVRFTGPGKWKTISAGESINITANGDIENL